MYLLLSLYIFFIGLQIQASDWSLLSGKYNYRIGHAQIVSYFCSLLATLTFVIDFVFRNGNIFVILATTLVLTLVTAVGEWALGRLNPKQSYVSWGFRFLLQGVAAYLLNLLLRASTPFLPFLVAGFYLRNNPFGIPHGKNLFLATLFPRRQAKAWSDMHFTTPAEEAQAPDTSYAGNNTPASPASKIYKVTEFGILPDTQKDLLCQLQALLDKVGAEGGGTIFFPKGKYYFNQEGDRFLQVNHSNLHLEGETDANGRSLASLINCGKTSRGHKNPWVSPFFITTGEALQESNNFWGLQFRKRQEHFTESSSLSDPGTDGSILTPDFATRIIASSQKGETILHVEDSSKVGKYILLGLYNTTPDGNLIKDILGKSELNPEWTVANRAGQEEAPSYQWLIEVRRIVDEHTIETVRPLLRDCDMQYAPAIFNVEMLENISIQNLIIDSTWNGQFRHHGFPLYYSIEKSREMDYGWNAINMKRVAHALVSNVIINNFTNPLYIMDSRNVTVSHVTIKGYNGHQGLKVYMHACDNLFEDIRFYNHFADMMGGEGNAYGNVFRRISYLNPLFEPVDYDFHGFAEAPMSPPAHNIFQHIYGFRYIKSGGPLSHLPSCAQDNVWWNTTTEGERRGEYLFYAMTYRQKKGFLRFVTAVGYAVAMIQKKRNLSPCLFIQTVREKLSKIDETGVPRSQHRKYLPGSIVLGIDTTSKV